MLTAHRTNHPLVSVVVPTRNSAQFLEACLASIASQSYDAIELIVVDNFSTDTTKAIAEKYTDNVFEKGPERSAQRNFGVTQSSGDYVLIIDSDMELSKEVVTACVAAAQNDTDIAGVIIPEESFGQGFWAQCKKLERSFYVGVDWMEAARFFPKHLYASLGGYDETMVSGEDWDLSSRAAAHGRIARIAPFIYHNEGRLKLITTLKKKYYYAQQFARYTNKHANAANVRQQTGIVSRYALFFSRPSVIARHPLRWGGMMVMKTGEFLVGGVGYLA